MTKKEQIEKMLEKYATKDREYGRVTLSENDFENVADEIVKLFLIPHVSGSLPCSHEMLEDTGVGYYICNGCGWYKKIEGNDR